MRFLALSIKIIFALYLAKFAAQQVLFDNYYIIGAIIVGIVVILFTSWKQKFYVFAIFVFLPFSFPTNFNLPFRYWSDLFAFILFAWFFIEILMKRQDLLTKKATLLMSAIAVITLWSVINYLYNPVSGSSFLGASQRGGGIRAYLVILSGISTFFVGFWFFKYEKINAGRCLLVLLLIVLVLGNLKIAGFRIPLLGRAYALSGLIHEGDFVKITGMRNLSIIGFPVLFGFYFRKKWNIIPFLILINLVVFCVLGGGRAIFAGIVVATSLYFALINRRHLLPVIAIVLMLSAMYVLFLSNSDFKESQYARVIYVEGGLKKQNTIRYYSYLYMWDIFKRHPVFGKGIGYEAISRKEDFFKDYPKALEEFHNLEIFTVQGSHGAYMSMLSIFGIGGIYFLFVMVFGGMYYSYRIAVRNNSSDEEVRIAVFIFVFLGIMTVHMYTGGTGYNYRDIWFLPGVIAGLLARDKTEKINNGMAEYGHIS